VKKMDRERLLILVGEDTIPQVKMMEKEYLLNSIGTSKGGQRGGDGGTKPQGTSALSRIIGVDQMFAEKE
jgi:hypothetical protein